MACRGPQRAQYARRELGVVVLCMHVMCLEILFGPLRRALETLMIIRRVGLAKKDQVELSGTGVR